MTNPISTISSIAFGAVAILIAYHDAKAYSLLITSLTVLSAGSALFHARGEVNKTPEHYADKGAIYAVATALIWHAWGSLPWLLPGLSLGLALVLLNLRRVDLFTFLPPLMLVIAAGIAVTVSLPAAVIASIVGAGALAVRWIEPQKDWIHGLWHVLVAAAVGVAWWVIHFKPELL